MATTLIFIRHGESEGNKRHLWLGQLDLPLTPHGVRQAELSAAYLDDRKIDALYASDLLRTMMTAEPVAQRQGLSIIPEAGLREIYGGDWQGHTYEDLITLFAEDYGVWRTDIGRSRCTNGESAAELGARMRATVEDIVHRHAGQTVCIVTHAAALRSLKCGWYGLPIERMQEVAWPRNASVTIVRYEDDGRVTITIDDEVGHLGDTVTGIPQGIV